MNLQEPVITLVENLYRFLLHIVIVEKPGYIHEIRIPDVLGFCTVKEGGEIEYYRNADG